TTPQSTRCSECDSTAQRGSYTARLSAARLGTKPAIRSVGAISARAQPDPGAQEFLGIDGFAVDPRFIMQMRSGGAAGRADFANHLADPDAIADLDVDFRQMAVAGRKPIAMIDFDHAAIAAGPPG